MVIRWVNDVMNVCNIKLVSKIAGTCSSFKEANSDKMTCSFNSVFTNTAYCGLFVDRVLAPD